MSTFAQRFESALRKDTEREAKRKVKTKHPAKAKPAKTSAKSATTRRRGR